MFIIAWNLFSDYRQIKLEGDCKQKTSFVCQKETFQFEVMPFRVTNVPSTFQRTVNAQMVHLEFVRVCLDDVVTFSKMISEHLDICDWS